MRIRRVTYDLGNVIERQEYLDGRYGAPGEKRAKKKKATPEEVEQVNQCFKILMRYGWSYEREEADLVYGNHELYKKES